jgi:hypothetical protein
MVVVAAAVVVGVMGTDKGDCSVRHPLVPGE